MPVNGENPLVSGEARTRHEVRGRGTEAAHTAGRRDAKNAVSACQHVEEEPDEEQQERQFAQGSAGGGVVQ